MSITVPTEHTVTEPTADVGVIGMAVMGSNLARNFASHGYTVALFNRTPGRTRDLMAAYGTTGSFGPTESVDAFVASLKRPRRIILMVQAGDATDATITSLLPYLEEGDIVVDGGNSHFPDTIRREAGAAGAGPALRRRRHLRRRGGRAARPGDHARRHRGVVQVARPDAGDHRRQGRRRPVLHPRRAGRRRALREDGAQRHRVRRHAADR